LELNLQRFIKTSVSLVMLFALSVQAQQPDADFSYGQLVFPEQGVSINIEVAKTRPQRSIGLMFRESLAADKGMLFIFEEEVIQRVWMKNTLIPLDIMFISSDGKLVSLLSHVQPCRQPPCAIYNSHQPAKYMLEVNAGFIERTGITVTQKIRFSLF
jgi:uncharacterized membrane protein (UPF0127 family)